MTHYIPEGLPEGSYREYLAEGKGRLKFKGVLIARGDRVFIQRGIIAPWSLKIQGRPGSPSLQPWNQPWNRKDDR